MLRPTSSAAVGETLNLGVLYAGFDATRPPASTSADELGDRPAAAGNATTLTFSGAAPPTARESGSRSIHPARRHVLEADQLHAPSRGSRQRAPRRGRRACRAAAQPMMESQRHTSSATGGRRIIRAGAEKEDARPGSTTTRTCLRRRRAHHRGVERPIRQSRRLQVAMGGAGSSATARARVVVGGEHLVPDALATTATRCPTPPTP